jgi:CRP-like cAMP-binding protein
MKNQPIEREQITFNETLLAELKLTDLQQDYLNVLRKEKTIEAAFNFYLKQGWLISFAQFFSLLEILFKNRAIQNLNFYRFFKNQSIEQEGFFKTFLNSFSGGTGPRESNSVSNGIAPHPADLNQYPFFRNLSPELVDLMKRSSYVMDVPKDRLFIREGQKNRDLYVLINGTMAVYKTSNKSKYKIVDLKSGSVFGEIGFLLGEPRTSDVVTTSPCKILCVKYDPALYEGRIKKDKAFLMLGKFWAIHALMKSELFRDLPAETVDQLLAVGVTREFAASQVIFQENSMGNSCFIIVQGQVGFSQKGRAINQLGQGHVFGEIALFYSAGVRTATAIATKSTIALEISRDHFYRLLSQNLILGREIEALALTRLDKDRRIKQGA